MRKKRVLWLLGATILALSFSAWGVGVEARIGTGPSLSLLADRDLTARLSLSLSMGIAWGEGTQTPSATLQTPSYTLAFGLRYTLADPAGPVVPYLGAGGHLNIRGSHITVLSYFSTGLRVRLARNLHLLAEGTVRVPLAGPGRWRLEGSVGVRYRF